MLLSRVLLAPARSVGTSSSAGPLATVQYRFVCSCSSNQLLGVCSSESVQWVREQQSRRVFRARDVSRCVHEGTTSFCKVYHPFVRGIIPVVFEYAKDRRIFVSQNTTVYMC